MFKKLAIFLILLFTLFSALIYYQKATVSKSKVETKTPESAPQVKRTQVEPAKKYEGWKTIQTKYYAYQIPGDWMSNIGQYSGSTFSISPPLNSHCNFVPGNLMGSLGVNSLSYTQDVTEDEFYSVKTGQSTSGNGGRGEVDTSIITIGDKKAIRRQTLWTSGIECWQKPFIDVVYSFYFQGYYPVLADLYKGKALQLEVRYFPDEAGRKETIEKILSTLNF